MSYIANSLAPHERLVLEARFPWLLRAATWAVLLLVGFAPVLTWTGFALAGRATPGAGIAAAAVGLLGLAAFVRLQLYMMFTETGVTDQRFVIKRGVIARHAADFPLAALENIDVRQGVLARLFGFGRLSIAGAGETRLMTPPMQDPVTFRTAIAESRIALADAPAFRAQAVKIDPMQRANGPQVDARGGERHVHPRRPKAAPERRGLRRAARDQAGPPEGMR